MRHTEGNRDGKKRNSNQQGKRYSGKSEKRPDYAEKKRGESAGGRVEQKHDGKADRKVDRKEGSSAKPFNRGSSTRNEEDVKRGEGTRSKDLKAGNTVTKGRRFESGNGTKSVSVESTEKRFKKHGNTKAFSGKYDKSAKAGDHRKNREDEKARDTGSVAVKKFAKKEEYRNAKQSNKNVFASQSSNVKSPCPVFSKCGGCQLLNMTYEQQLEMKQKELVKILKPFCPVHPIAGMENPFHYRNKVHAVFDHDGKGNPFSGIYKANSHEVVPVENCLIEDEKADEIIGTIRGMLKSFKIRTFDEDTGYGLLRHVLVKRGFATGEIMVVLVTASPVFPSKNNFVTALCEKHPEITTIIQNVNNRSTSMVLGDKEKTLFGKGYIEDVLCGCTFRISSKSFYQVNPVQTEVLYNKAIEAAELTGKETVIDAYCGIGTIGIIASKKAGKVIGIELKKDAVKDAWNNAKRNDIKNVEFYCNDAGTFMRDMAEQGERVDVVFMDPPRGGSTEEFMDSVAKMGPEKVVYISCNPVTLERDLQYFKKIGYGAKEGWGVDMFPMTENVETVVLLTRNLKPKYEIDITIPMEEGEPNNSKEYNERKKATYPKIKDYIKNTYGVNTHTRDIAEVRRRCGLDMRENYNKSKKENPKIRQTTPEKEEYIKAALKHLNAI